MQSDRDLLKQALEALEDLGSKMMVKRDAAIAALRERLTQPEQTVPSDHSNSHQPEQWEQFYPDMGKPLDRMAENARELGLDYEPVQEPVAWIDEFGNVFPLGAQRGPKWLNEPMKPLYTTPPRREWVGLTEEEFELLEVKHAPLVHPDVKEDDWWEFARAIEAKLREKNA